MELFNKKYEYLNDAIYKINLDSSGSITCKYKLDDIIYRLENENPDLPNEKQKEDIMKKAKQLRTYTLMCNSCRENISSMKKLKHCNFCA